MRIIETIREMRDYIKTARRSGKTIGLVPTMGALHQGHLTLVRAAKAECNVVVVSIFVNPVQFGPNEDFNCYPRDLAGDGEKAANAGADVIFHPAAEEMYPQGYAAYVHVEGISEKLCGMSRPGHFRGVATVVTKLFNIVQPDVAYFGQKDAQQVVIIQRMAADLNMDVAIRTVPIVREPDGLAMSSRNAYLSKQERRAALVLSQSLFKAMDMAAGGERRTETLRNTVENLIRQESAAKIDYVEILRYPDLEETEFLNGQALLALAVRIGNTRLIDNVILEAK
jgi:pantoate--beta-alanine ligase